jgi:hypothetical protein
VCHRTCPVCQRTQTSNSSPSGNARGDSAIIHRTVQCTLDMSGAPRKSGLRNSPASRIHFSRSAKIHRTVRCNSGATTISAPTATCDALNARAACAEVRHAHAGAPDTQLGLGIRSIRVIRFGLFGFVKFRVFKNENRNFQKYFRNRTRIDLQFRFGLFGPPNRPEL